MKRMFWTLTAAAMLSACTLQQKQENGGTTAVSTDSAVVASRYGDYRLVVDVPSGDNKALQRAVLEYVSESCGGTYAGDLLDTKALLRHYTDSISHEYDEDGKDIGFVARGEMRMENSKTFKKIYENERLITYEFDLSDFSGGAHGMSICSGQTFRKSDGRRLGWELFNRSGGLEINDLLKAGLKRYFETDTDEALEEQLQNATIYDIPLPNTPPLFKEDGILVVYEPYEIACYAAGMPSFTIPYDEIRPLMVQTALDLIRP